MDPKQDSPTEVFKAKLGQLKDAYRETLDQSVWEQVHDLKRQLNQAKDQIIKIVGMLDQADGLKSQIENSHESLQKIEQEFEEAKAQCIKYIEQLTREAEDKE